MKRFAFIFAAFAACFAVSCNKEMPESVTTPTVQDGFKTVTITADIADADTKTSYDADGKFSWTKGDQISVLASDEQVYTFTATETGASSAFTGVIPADVTLGAQAFFPADDNHALNSFSLAATTDAIDASLPLIGVKGDGDAYEFAHYTGGFQFTITNIPAEIKVVEASFVTSSLKISGIFSVWKDDAGKYISGVYAAANDDEKKYARKMSVAEGTAKVYLPYGVGGDLWGTTTMTLTGYDADGNATELTTKELKLGGLVHSRAVIIPVKPLALNNLDVVDWESENVATVTNAQDSEDAKCEELKVVADEYFVYAWVKCTLETPFNANYIDIYLSDGDASGEGAAVAWDQWPGTIGVDIYKKEHKGTIDSDGNLTSMTFNYNGEYKNIDYNTVIAENKINWYFAFPITYLSNYKSEDNKIYVGFRLWTDWSNYAAIPARGWGQSMLEVTLP